MTQPLLEARGFFPWLTARFFSNIAKQMEVLVVSWQIYRLTHSPLALGLIGLAQALPYVIVALWAGHVADFYEKKRQIVVSIAGSMACASLILILSVTAETATLPIYLALGLASIFISFELAASSAYLQMTLPKEVYPRGIAWNLALYQVATIGGPLLGGFIIDRWSVSAALGVVVAFYAAAFLISMLLKPVPPVQSREGVKGLRSIREGLKFLVSKEIIWACMVLDMFAVFFGDVIAILPVFADMLKVGPIGLGLLRASPAIGSFIVSTVEANRPFIQIKWRTFLVTVAAFGVCMIGFALSKNFFLTVFFLVGSGMADGISVVIRQSIYQRHTPDAFRGRVASVSGVFIRLSNEMGAFESGLMASLMGAVPSVIFGGAMTLVTAAIMRLKFPRLDEKKGSGDTVSESG